MRSLPDTVHTREGMIARGAYGYLDNALERYVPLERIIVLTPAPACADWGTYRAVGGLAAIELKYSREEQAYLAFNAQSVIVRARQRGDQYIRAFVEPDEGDVGAFALPHLPKEDNR
ncbi:MAG: hypothetical protein WAM77_14655 [Xanthobacteraceae bacterium]|jgi:hypothetical protein